MASSSLKKRRSTFRLSEQVDFDAGTITKIATARSKCGLVIANSADPPLWLLSDDELSQNISKRPKPALFEESPLKGTFTDGFAMYSTFPDVENCSVKLAVNATGSEVLKSVTNMFKETANGVKDFFIYYSGTGKSFNGDWMCHNEESDRVNIIPLDRLVSKWKSRPNPNKNQYLLILSDTNYSGIWVSKAKDRKLLQRENILVQSAVGRQEPSLEMTIGEIKPPCWITQIVCGKFTHNWLEICASPFYDREKAVIDMKGSFVVLDRRAVWDENDEYFAETDHPMSNVSGPNEECTMIGIPCYGYTVHHDADDDGDAVIDSVHGDDEEKKDDGDGNKGMRNGVRFGDHVPDKSRLQIGSNGPNASQHRESGHLPKPSVRRLNLLQGVVGGMQLKKHKKKKSRHVSTYSRGFVFTRVLKEVRHMVMGSEDEEETEDENSEWEE